MQTGVLIQSFLMVFLAEMGDKSQFLLLALSKRHRKREILLGSALAILLLNWSAVLLGGTVGAYLPHRWISIVAGMAFLYFAVSAFAEGEKEVKTHTVCGKWAVGAVFGTYFLAELGDKTQLTALTLAADAELSAWGSAAVFIGTSLGLFLSGTMAILLGGIFDRYLSERLFASLSAILFLACGVIRLLEGFGALFAQTSHPVLFSVLPTVALTFGCLMWIGKERYKNEKKHARSEQSVCSQ
jgi:putative Ca2+/H+ antiporter (TMEM165/GDT1 family)